MPKPFLTFEAQISYLETDKNLMIQDHDYAKTMLKRIGYFSLIGGYKVPFKNPTTRIISSRYSSLLTHPEQGARHLSR